MPQETKARPFDADALEIAPGTAQEKLQGWVAPLGDEAEIRAALEKAFDYRGDVTLRLKDGSQIEGYLFDREGGGASLADCHVRIFPKDSDQKLAVRYSDIAGLAFTGRDTAEGRSFATWVKKHRERKAAGEKNIRLEPEKLD
jgi:hypothetical protein